MSATGRGSPRNPDDLYETPGWAVRRFLEKFTPPPGKWLEPGAGTGAIIRAANAGLTLRPWWTAVEKRVPTRVDAQVWIRADFLRWSPRMNNFWFDFAIGNPPYSLARQFADKCFSLAKVTAFLLRLNFAESAERQPWFRQHPADIYILPDRPSFCTKVRCTRCGWTCTFPANAVVPRIHARCGGKVLVTRTDATGYCWMVWGDGAGVARDPKVVWLDRTPAKERGAA